MLGSQHLCNFPCGIRLIIFLLPHTNGKALYPAVIQRLHQCHNGTAVDSRRKESAHRHIRRHLIPDGILQQPFQFRSRFLPAAGKRILLPFFCRLLHRPERFHRRAGKGRVQSQDTSRLQLPYIPVYGVGRRNIAMDKINIQHILIYFITEPIQRGNGTNIGCVNKASVYKTII